MDVTGIPFNRFLGIRKNDPPDRGALLLPEAEHYLNHLGTVHASAQFALAEAASGEFLLRKFGYIASTAPLIPVVREVQVKFRKPASGALTATACVEDTNAEQVVEALTKKGRAIIPVTVNILDASGNTTMSSVFTWFVQKAASSSAASGATQARV